MLSAYLLSKWNTYKEKKKDGKSSEMHQEMVRDVFLSFDIYEMPWNKFERLQRVHQPLFSQLDITIFSSFLFIYFFYFFVVVLSSRKCLVPPSRLERRRRRNQWARVQHLLTLHDTAKVDFNS